MTVTAVLQCAGNGRAFHSPRVPGVQWGHGAMGQATFTGARLRDVLAAAAPSSDVAYVHMAGADAPPKPTVPAFLRSIPIARALDPSTLVAWAMNGAPLTLRAHGAPLRLVVPGWAGDHWVKWLSHVGLQKEEASGFYMQTAYKVPGSPAGTRGDREARGDAVADHVPGEVGDRAAGRGRPCARRQPGARGLRVLGRGSASRGWRCRSTAAAPWRAASLEGAAGAGRWQIWRLRFDARPGRITAMVRATDRSGNPQPEKAAWNPSGYFFNAWHTVSWEVA